jgi:methionyl-tRNA formyltransferase
MRIIFAGTPEFARVALARLHDAGFEIALMLTQPDRPAGRGMKLQASAVKQWAQSQAAPIALAQPRSLRLDGKFPADAAVARAAIEAARADVMVVAAYGLILPQWVLDAPKLGCLNIHASLLPRWRGAAPIHRAIEAGDQQTGVTIMQMDAGLDTGAMLLVQSLAISPQDSAESLHDKLADLGGQLIVEALQQAAAAGGLQAVPQPLEGVTYAHKIEKREALLDWTQSAATLERRIRAFNPFPGAAAVLAGETIKFWRAAVLAGVARPADAQAGQVLAVGPEGVDICTLDAVLRVSRLQKAGGKSLDAADFLRGFEIRPGMVFSQAAPAP